MLRHRLVDDIAWPPPPRAPLPPFDPATFESADPNTPPSWHPVYTTMWAPPLPPDNPRWWRGDAWGVTIPGLPPVPGGASGPAQSRVLTYFLDRYGREWEDKIIDAHLARGYRHFSISPQDSFAAGMSEDDYVAMAIRLRQAGFFVHHLMRSKYYTSASAATSSSRRLPIAPYLERGRPVCRNLDGPQPGVSTASVGINLDEPNRLIDKLLSAGAMQIHTPAWEMNYWSPEICRAMIDHDAARIGMACLIMTHMYPHYIAWPRENYPTPGRNETSAEYWLANFGKVDGHLYQCDPSWSAGMMAARMTDSLDRLAPGGMYGLGDSGRGHPIDIVGWETIATQQYGNLHDGNGKVADEDDGNLKGFELSCAPGKMPVMGYGNGARNPDGAAL